MCGFDINGRADAGDGAEGAICEVDAEGRRAVDAGQRRVEWMQGINVRIGCKGATHGADEERRRVEWMQRGHMWSECRGQCAK